MTYRNNNNPRVPRTPQPATALLRQQLDHAFSNQPVFARRPLMVPCARITEENIVAWGEVLGRVMIDSETGRQYIEVDRSLIQGPKKFRLMLGSWVAYFGYGKIRVYKNRSFLETFEEPVYEEVAVEVQDVVHDSLGQVVDFQPEVVNLEPSFNDLAKTSQDWAGLSDAELRELEYVVPGNYIDASLRPGLYTDPRKRPSHKGFTSEKHSVPENSVEEPSGEGDDA